MKNKELTHRVISESASIRSGFKFSLGGLEASDQNNRIIHDCLDHWVLISLETVGVTLSEVGMAKRLVNFTREVMDNDFIRVLESLDAFYRIIISGDINRFSEFKAHASRLGCLLPLLSPVYDDIERWYDTQSYACLAHIIQWVRFPTKLHFEMKSLEDKALQDYLDSEIRLGSIDFTGNPHVKHVNQILRNWLHDFNVVTLPVRHGPGSVAEGRLTKAEKYLSLRDDTRIRYLLSRIPDGNAELYYPFGLSTDKVSSRTAKVVFVPKSASKLRTICMEPVTLQYFQQGIMRLLVQYFRTVPEIYRHVSLEDQRPNQRCARLGSMFQTSKEGEDYATIDLKAASDSVSWSLVKLLFSGTPLLKWLLATRSTHTLLPDKSIIKNVKYAPMGSALCFPIECLIFAACTEYSVRLHYRSDRSLTKVPYRVYGDDIVVSSKVYPLLAEVLESFGFIVNREKTYSFGPFRESCGKEYYEGYDVTPLYYRLNPIGNAYTSSEYLALCSAANNAALHGLSYLRAKYIDTLLTKTCDSKYKRIKKLKPLFGESFDRPPFIWSPNPTNFLSRKRWNKDYQIMEYEALTVASADIGETPEIVSDTINYFEFLVERNFKPSLVQDSDNDSPSYSVVPRYPVPSRSWIDWRFCKVTV